MTNDVDDLDFVVNGVMGVLMYNLFGDGTTLAVGDGVNTGQDNGGS
jgi:hypothetical protein